MDISVDEFLTSYTPEVQDLSRQVRAIVLNVFPDANERVHPGWKVISYKLGDKMKDQVCYIAPFKSYMHLGFERGAELPDPKGLLEGKGKLMRHVKIEQGKDIDAPALRKLLKAALAAAKKYAP